MGAARFAFCLLLVLAVTGESQDIFERLRRSLGPAGESAAQALAAKDFSKVDEILAKAKPSNNAQRAELLSLQGAVDFVEGKMAPAATAFRQASAIAPLTDPDTFTLAMALVKLGDDAEARAALTKLSERRPDNAIYIYWLGRLDYDQRRYQEAVAKLERATKLDPQSTRAWDSLGLAFDMQGQADQARTTFQRAVELNRNQEHPSPWPPHDLGYLLLRMDQVKEAESALRESLRYDPNFAQAHYHLGRVLEKEERDTQAIEEYKRAVSLDASSPDACYSLAMLYRKLHRNAEAEAMFAEYRKRRQPPRP
ncbi:MAG: tetratricopeptide repeat protein [Acidobacteriaceae bacterium]|nr:tetratricopeptide repeat protein [Acidobacteriaceae bacterium]